MVSVVRNAMVVAGVLLLYLAAVNWLLRTFVPEVECTEFTYSGPVCEER